VKLFDWRPMLCARRQTPLVKRVVCLIVQPATPAEIIILVKGATHAIVAAIVAIMTIMAENGASIVASVAAVGMTAMMRDVNSAMTVTVGPTMDVTTVTTPHANTIAIAMV
jgi:hypothetical protein